MSGNSFPSSSSIRVDFHFFFLRNTSCQTQTLLQVQHTKKLQRNTQPVPNTTLRLHRATTITRLTKPRPARQAPCHAAIQQLNNQQPLADVLPSSTKVKPEGFAIAKARTQPSGKMVPRFLVGRELAYLLSVRKRRSVARHGLPKPTHLGV
jgi:hypothetical protein